MSKQCAGCCGNVPQDQAVYGLDNKLLLMGNPNVGKSVIFSDMTGVHVMSSNYAGTTVGYTHAKMTIGKTASTAATPPAPGQESWNQAADMVAQCVTHTQESPKAMDRLGDALIKPWPLPLSLPWA